MCRIKKNPIITRVLTFTKFSAIILNEIVIPKKSVIRFVRVFCAVSDNELSTPHSFKRFPNIRNPTRETDEGATSPAIIVMMIGKSILVVLEIAFPL